MIAIDSPTVSDGLEAWEKWEKRLEELQVQFKGDKSIKEEMRRAKRMVAMFKSYPNGLNLKDPKQVKEALRVMSKAT